MVLANGEGATTVEGLAGLVVADQGRPADPEGLAARAEARFNREVGERLQHAREASGLTVSQVSGRLSVSRQTLSNYESGRTPLRASSIRELSILYRVSCDWILGASDVVGRTIQEGERVVEVRETSPRIYPASVRAEGERAAFDAARDEGGRRDGPWSALA